MKDIIEQIIKTAFNGKTDKAGKPYIEHLYRTRDNIKLFTSNSDDINNLENIALLHDLIEDCDEWNFEKLSDVLSGNDTIINTLKFLTRERNTDYGIYIENISKNRFATIVKLADLKDNMDVTRLKTLTDYDITRLKKYHTYYCHLMEINNTIKN